MILLLLLLSCSDPTAGPGQDCPVLRTWYVDSDGDGYGAGEAQQACSTPAGGASASGDCDDASASIHPDAEESCNGIDDNCDGEVDPETSTDAVLCYVDQDGDGYGTEVPSGRACNCPSGTTSGDTSDCDDDHADAHPGGTETWYDGVDGDCLGGDDYDADADGHQADLYGGDDCDDADPDTYLDAPEICGDGVDQDCDRAEPELNCGVIGTMDMEDASTVIVNRAQAAYFGISILYAGDNDGDGAGEVLNARYSYEGGDAYDEQVIYVVNNLAARGEVGLIDEPVAVFQPPGWEWDIRSEEFQPLPNFWNPAITGTDLDGDGLADFLLGSSNLYGDTDRIPSRLDLWYGPASGVIDLAEADSFQVEEPFGVPVVLTATDGAGAFQVAVSGYTGVTLVDERAIWLIDETWFNDDRVLDEAAGIWREADSRLLPFDAGDLDGDGISELSLQSYTWSGGEKAFTYAYFQGPLDDDLALHDAAMSIHCAFPDRYGFYPALLDTSESEDGVGYVAIMGGSDSCDGGDECGGVWVHAFEAGDIDYDENALVSLVGPPGSTAGSNAGTNGSWGGDLDGNGVPELMVTRLGDYGSLYVVEVPESGTYDLEDAVSAYIDAEASPDRLSYFGTVSDVGHDYDGDGFDDLVTSSFSNDGHPEWESGRIYLFRGGLGDF